MSDMPSIDRYLEGVLRAILTGDAVPTWGRAAEDWTPVWSRVDYHGIAFVLHQMKDRLTDWPEPLLARMGEECRLLALWEATHRLCVAKAVEALAAAQVPSVIMKGTALAYLVHRDPAARRRGDSDLLVRPQKLMRTREILSELGWRRQENTTGIYNQETWYHDAAEFFEHAIDLHWSPLDRPGLQRLLPIDEIFHESETLPAFSDHARRPSLPAMIIHATVNQCMHAQYGYFAEIGRVRSPQRLIWSLDFALMGERMEEADWEQLIDDCRTKRIGPLVGQALQQARDATGVKFPEGAIEALMASPLDADIAAYFGPHDRMKHFLIDLRATPGITGKARLIASRAFPPRRHLLDKYPASRNWPTALLQGRLILEAARRLVWREGSR